MTVEALRNITLKYVGPDDTSDAAYLSYLNQVRKRFYDSGKWKGLVYDVEQVFTGDTVTLPDGAESILGAQINNRPVVVFASIHEYIPGGPGEVTSTSGWGLALIDNGDRTYKIMGAGDNELTVRLRCKRRYQDLTANTDEVLPDNVGAIKLGLISLSYEDNNDLERAREYFSEALLQLNNDTKEARGGAQSVLQQSPHGFRLGRIRVLY